MFSLSIDDWMFDAFELETITGSKEFKEFCDNIERLSRLISIEYIIEARVENPGIVKKVAKGFAEPLADTVVTAGKVAGAYDNITYGTGKLMSSSFNVVMDVIGIITKLIRWISLNIAKLPVLISNTVTMVSEIPANVKHTLSGNIKLYIAPVDIAFFYKSIFPNIHNIIQLTEQLSKGDLFRMIKDENKFRFWNAGSDMKTIKKMRNWFVNIRNDLQFTHSIINLQDPNNINIYFGSSNSVKFIDLFGKEHSSTYYEGLVALTEDIDKMMPQLTNLNALLGNKVFRTRDNKTLSKLDQKEQQSIRECFSMIAKCVKILSDVNRCIISDMDTIRKACKKIMEKKRK